MTPSASVAYAVQADTTEPLAAEPLAAEQLRLGQAHYAAGRIEDAVLAFQCGLASAANAPSGELSEHVIPDLHCHLGNACLASGDLELAAANYKAALRIAPHVAACWCNLGNVTLKLGNAQDAIAMYLQALKIAPGHWASRTNLVQAVMTTKQFIVAEALLRELICERPHDSQSHYQLGKACFELNKLETAIECFEQAIALNPRDADSYYWIGGIKQRSGDSEAAQAAYAKGAQLQPLIRRPAAKSPAEYRVLALYAPFAGNTPTEYLFKDAAHDTDTLALFSGSEHDAASLRKDVQLVVNLVSDADQGESILPMVADLVDRLSLPTVNHPRMIQRTTRDAVAVLLDGIKHCRIPAALRLKKGADHSIEALRALIPFKSSVLARPVGTHGGDDFEKIDDITELAAFLAQHPDHDHYLIQYIDYRSSDDHFRKYRFIFVDGQILPYHLAIGHDWKVHHASTDMANRPWMQQEEEEFLNDPASTFTPTQYRALREIQQRIGLEYFGIDCGLDRCGNVVVFEVNASMLVHDRNEEFLYKAPAVQRIKQAFDAMLRKLALG